METRVGQVEAAITERMQEQVNLLAAITHTQSQHTADLVSLKQKDKANQETFTDIKQRLTKLESAPLPSPLRANSSTTAEERQPALIMGGWADDQDAAFTLPLAKDAVANLQLDVDMQEAFVKRGYLVVPYAPKQHESEGNMYKRLTQAIQKVRQANQTTSAVNPDGQVKPTSRSRSPLGPCDRKIAGATAPPPKANPQQDAN